MRFALLGLVVAVAGCTEPPSGPPLLSAQFPPGTGLVNAASEPQPVGSLPPGAGNVSTAPGATWPDYASLTLRLR